MPDQQSLQPTLEKVAAQSGRSFESYIAASQTVAGTPEQVVDQLGKFKEAGCSYTIGYFSDSVWGDSIDLFAAEVMPHL